MTTANLREAIESALSPKPDEPTVRLAKREAERIVAAAEQGAGPEPLEESLFVVSLVHGADAARHLADDATVVIPDFGVPGQDYLVDDAAVKVFDVFFRRHRIPVGGARAALVEEMQEQLLNPGKGRRAPEGTFLRVDFGDLRGQPFIGRIDPKARTFFVEEPGAGRGGESVFYGPYRIDRKADPPR
jgi:hypothetical protein